MPVALGNSTRIVQFLLPAGKEYVCIMHLHDEVPREKIEKIIKSKFIGKIRQLPPVKSAIKRQMRNRKIYYLDILEVKGQDVLFKVGCQAGTYIRKLCHDIGIALGTAAHMAQLVRTKAGPFKYDNTITLHDLSDTYHFYKEDKKEDKLREIIQPVESAVAHLPKVWVLDAAVKSLCHGSNLKVPGVSKIQTEIQIDEYVAIMTLKNELIAVGSLKMIPKNVLTNDRGVVVKVEKVFMEPDVYPRLKK